MQNDEAYGLLYDARDERDACGVGFIADVSGRQSRGVLETALEALKNLEHRGAVGADGRTGDGAGVLTQLPARFFLSEVARLGYTVTVAADLAVGMFFLPRDENAAAACREIVNQAIARNGLVRFGWRPVPVDHAILGAKALATAPVIEQLLTGRGHVRAGEFETTLGSARRQIEEEVSNIPGFYISSLSSRTIVYKGMCVARQLEPFYRDLGDPLFETALAVLHQRYSTNTFPNWRLAQPFRLLAHNGEINTIAGNRNWMRARDNEMLRRNPGSPDLRSGWSEGSDSSSLDKALEFLMMNGRDITQGMMTLIPEAYENSVEMDRGLRSFYEYSSCVMEPWDGPAAVAFTDGRVVGAALDRNGLRPTRYAVTREGRVVVTSEAGAVALDLETVVAKGRLGPGEMIAVDTERGLLLKNNAIKKAVSGGKAYESWARRSILDCKLSLDDQRSQDCKNALSDTASLDATLSHETSLSETALLRRMKAFGYTAEDLQRILDPMLVEGKEPAGSMGDDTPLAVLSHKPRLLYSYFRQQFAQVTNPPIDSIRERLAMSLETLLGPRLTAAEQTPATASLIKLSSPILSDATLDWLKRKADRRVTSTTLHAVFDVGEGEAGLKRSLEELCERAISAVEVGAAILIISDLEADEFQAAVPMLLAVGAIHNHLIREGRRLSVSLIAQTGEARDDHQIACLIGCGANAVNPALAFEVIALEGEKQALSIAVVLKNYRRALENGLRKIMAKMGIATAASYCGSQAFEVIGLDAQLVETHFTGAVSRIGGIGLAEIAVDVLRFHGSGHTHADASLEDAGYFRYRNGGEYHSYNPSVFKALHRAARNGGDEYARYAEAVLERQPAVLRDLIEFRCGNPIPLEEVESAERILGRFSTSGMSLGALSKEAHETLAIAMNRLGAKSNSGEGGEDRVRFKRRANGDLANSRVKQVASARFGVTPEYLVSADELEIKMAQGSKPGEGGQLPGHKVTAEIAALRHSVPGVTLISPPPHHDIYSIEDLAQLIFDLKQINPEARIAVKLVSEAGIGTIAAGVAKAHADVIHISGHDGGTGASPLGSIKNAGTPWELGLAETQQALVLNDLRGRVRLRVDGGLKTGRDVIIAAMLGAEEFGFATAAVVAMGCVMARQCHLNTCPVGLATQDLGLRRKFKGNSGNVMRFFRALAEDVRELLASLGFRTVDEIIGRSDLLSQKPEHRLPKTASLDLSPVLNRADESDRLPLRSNGAARREVVDSLGDRVERACSEAIASRAPVSLEFEIKNTDRAVGARLAGTIARRYGDAGLPDRTVDLRFNGSAGQSFGAFNIAGVRLTLIGEANDYVGKSTSGGEIIIRPPAGSRFDWSKNVIAGNTVMYGATGGVLFVAGRAGERFCVRNSGGVAVVEGVGDHGCEYMTAGVVVVLGEVGRNFAAGMTGGAAYIFDEQRNFEKRCNTELVRIGFAGDRESRKVRSLVERHYDATHSPRARSLLSSWQSCRNFLFKVAVEAEPAQDPVAEAQAVSAAAKLDTQNFLAAE